MSPVASIPNRPQGPDNRSIADMLANFDSLIAVINALDEVNLATALAQRLGISQAGTPRRGYAEVLTDEATTSAVAVDLATVGPSVTVNVPANGLVLLKATVDLKAGTSDTAAVHLVEDNVNKAAILQESGAAFVTRNSLPGSSAGTTLDYSSGLVAFAASAGAHTYKLKYYNISGPANASNFRNRKLWVMAIGP